MNGTTLKQCRSFFNVEISDGNEYTYDEITRIASLLNETSALAASVFNRSVTLAGCGTYGLRESFRRGVRYCEECARYGYHSYLHEMEWLSRCPFHMSALKEAYSARATGTIAAQRISVLKKIMQSTCAIWPRADEAFFAPDGQGEIKHLSDWILRVTDAAADLATGEIWRSGDGSHRMSLTQVFGQLRTLHPMPETMVPLLTAPGEPWNVEIFYFPEQTQFELTRATAHCPFELIFDFYKRISAVWVAPPEFVKRKNQFQDLLKARHGSCRCNWELIKGGWESHWVMVHPEDWRYRDHYMCPFTVALEELELGWGRFDQVLSTRKARLERLDIKSLARDMHDAGLIKYRGNAQILSNEYPFGIWDTWPNFEWLYESPLTELLNLTAEVEVASAYSALTAWLDGIERGLNPGMRGDPANCIRLCKRASDLWLVKWSHAAVDMAH